MRSSARVDSKSGDAELQFFHVASNGADIFLRWRPRGEFVRAWVKRPQGRFADHQPFALDCQSMKLAHRNTEHLSGCRPVAGGERDGGDRLAVIGETDE